MGVFRGECKKILLSRQIWFGILFLLLSACLMTYFNLQKEIDGIDVRRISQSYERMEGTDAAALALALDLQKEPDFWEEEKSDPDGFLWPNVMAARIYRNSQIGDYIHRTIKEAEKKGSISVFVSSEYEKKNLRQTIAAYEKIKDKEFPLENTMAIEQTLKLEVLDALILFFALFMLDILIGRERESGILGLYSSCLHGRRRLAYAKISAVCIVTACLYGACLLGSFLFAGALAGGGSLQVPIQCLSGFEHSGSNLSVAAFLGIFFFSKVLYIGMKIALSVILLVLLDSFPISLFLLGAGCCLEILIAQKISSVSIFDVVNWMNPDSARTMKEGFRFYRNVNVLGEPIERWAVVLTSSLVSFGILFWVSSRVLRAGLEGRLRPIGLLAKWKRRAESLREKKGTFRRKDRRYRTYSLMAHERYKLWITGKAIFLVLLGLAFQLAIRGGNLHQRTGYIERVYRSMVESMEGELSEKTLRQVEVLREIYAQDEEKYQISLLILENRIEPQVRYLEEQARLGKKAVLFYDVPIKEFLGISSAGDLRDTLVLLIVVILVCCEQIAMDHRHRETDLLYTTKGGKKQLFLTKWKNAVGMVLLLLVLYSLPAFIKLMSQGGIHFFKYPLCSIKEYRFYSDRISIGAYLLGLMLWRGLISVELVLCIYGISEKMQRFMASVLVALLLLVLPSGLPYVMGKDSIMLGILPFINGNIIARAPLLQRILYGLMAFLASGGILFSFRKMIGMD